MSNVENQILPILRNSCEGRTITEITEISQLSRSAVRTALAKLEGAEKIKYRSVGMAKIYTINN